MPLVNSYILGCCARWNPCIYPMVILIFPVVVAPSICQMHLPSETPLLCIYPDIDGMSPKTVPLYFPHVHRCCPCAVLQASGVSVSDECIETFDEIKLGHKHRYAIYTLNGDQDTIVVEQRLSKCDETRSATPEEKYSSFHQVLADKHQTGDCCYAVYDAEYTRHNGQRRSKIIFLVWSVKLWQSV